MSLARTRSQAHADALAAAESPSIKSLAQCRAVLAEIASVDCPQVAEIPDLSIASKDLTNSAITGTLKKHFPTLVSMAQRATSSQNKVLEIVGKAKAVLAYMGSEQYEKDLAESIISKGWLDGYIAQKVAEHTPAGSAGSGRRGSGKARKARNVALEDHCHYAVAYLCHVHYRKKSYLVNSPLKTWPDPTETETVEIDDGEGGTRVVWRPQWSDFLSEHNESFIDEVVAKIEGDFGEVHTEEEIRSALEVFFESIVRQRRDVAKGVDEANKANKRKESRSKSTSMSIKFAKSLLETCAERDLLYSAIRNEAIYLSPLARNEAHGLPVVEVDEDGAFAGGFDGFQLFMDLAEEKAMPDDTNRWVVRDAPWWSAAVRLGFWCLYEQSKPSGAGAKPRTEIFHVPTPYRQVQSLSNLPLLATSDQSAAESKKAGRVHLSRGMIDDSVLSAAPYQDWSADLSVDAPIRDGRPTLQALLDRPENAALASRVRAHIVPPKAYDDDVYERVWTLRREGRVDEYVKCLRSDDWLAFLLELDEAE